MDTKPFSDEIKQTWAIPKTPFFIPIKLFQKLLKT